MKNWLIYITIICLCSCSNQQEQFHNKKVLSSIVETSGYTVSVDSLAEPIVVQTGTPKVVSAYNPQIITTNTNVYIAGKPKIVIANSPTIIKHGQGSKILPKSVTTICNPFLAGLPEVVLAKEPTFKDHNSTNFYTYNKLQGLKNNQIKCILQDRSGNLWFGTDGGGVAKYDGKYFTNYTQKEGLGNNRIFSMLEDRNGNLWFSTYGRGVSKYDGKYITNFTEKDGLINNNISSILEDKRGNLWFGTLGGAVKLSVSDTIESNEYTFTHFTVNEGLCSNRISSIIQDNHGNLWFGTNGGGVSRLSQNGVEGSGEYTFTNFNEKDGLSSNRVLSILQDDIGNLWFGTNGGGISKLTLDDTKESPNYTFTQFTEKEGLSNNVVFSILQDLSGKIWLGTFYGLCKFDTNTETNGQASFTRYTEDEGLSNNVVSCLLQDKNGNIWFGSDGGGGVTKYDRKLITHFTKEQGLSNNLVYSIFQDKSGTLWLGSDGGGLSKYDGKSFTHFNMRADLNNKRVRCILQDKFGNIWFGSYGGGLSKLTHGGVEGSSEYTYTQFTEKEGLSNNNVFCMMQDKIGNIWLGTTGGGIIKYDGNRVDAIERGENITKQEQQDLQRINGKLIRTFTYFTEKQGLSNNRVYSIFQDKHENIWIGTDGGGVSKLTMKNVKGTTHYSFTHFTEKEGLSNNCVYSIMQDDLGNLWFGTNGGGLSKLSQIGNDESGKYTFTNFTEKEGLSNNIVYSLLYDNVGNLWIGTSFGLNIITQKDLVKLNSESQNGVFSTFDKSNLHLPNVFKTLTFEDGFLGIGCNRGAICEDKNNNIWVGTNDRLSAYQYEEDEKDIIAPEIQLTGIELFNENIAWVKFEHKFDTSITLVNGVIVDNFKFDGTTKWYGLPTNLSLKYNNNFLTFRYIGITLNHSKRVKYQFMLEGLDKNWSVPTFQNETSYGNLPHGIYTFRVKAMNSEGYWSNEYNYTFSIRPPWWKTLLFRISLWVFVISSIFFLYRWRIASLKRQKKKLELIVKEQTLEVVEQKEELEAYNEELASTNEELFNQREELDATLHSLKETQNQLIQSEKMASLGVLAAGIAHEINNPLNFIQGGITGIKEHFNANPVDKDSNIDFFINAISEGVETAVTIVSGLNHFSRTGDYITEKINIHTIIDNCLLILQNNTKNRIEIIKNYTEIPYNLVGNEGKLHQAILNIIANAVQSICCKGTITIKTEVQENKIKIYVTDTGCGISEENINKILDPFFTTKEPGKGTGLGLSITYNILHELNGKIEFESKLDFGTTTIVTLPQSSSN